MQHLALQAIGVDEDVQPRSEYPPLQEGVHLRWGFPPHRGFPPGGYYLLRRNHPNPRRAGAYLSQALDHAPDNPLGGAETPGGHRFEFEDHSRIATTPVQGNNVGISISGSARFRIEVPAPAFRVDVSIVTEVSGGVTVRAFSDGRVVDETTTSGGTVSLRGDRIDAIDCPGGQPKYSPVIVAEVATYLVSNHLRQGWELLPDAPAPIRLPVAHEDYGGDGAPTSLDDARKRATGRIAYGDPARVTGGAAPEPAPGTVSVTEGSHYAFATGLDTDPRLVGDSLRVHGDESAYGIAAVGEETDAGTRVVLNRPYRGPSGDDRQYQILDDEFAALHDTLSVLVDGNGGGGSGGAPVGGMGSRAIPAFEDPGGMVARVGDPSIVYGLFPDWETAVAGSRIRFETGSFTDVLAVHGRPFLLGADAGLDDSFVGDYVRIDDEHELYRIADVEVYRTPSASFEICRLDRPVSGPHYGDTVDCVAYSQTTHRIASVDANPPALELEHDAVGLRDKLPRRYLIHPDAPDGASGSLPVQNPLDTVLTAAIDPAAAQALGIYWIDDTVDSDAAYDYMVVADHGDVIPATADLDAQTVLDYVPPSPSSETVDWYVASHVRGDDATPLSPPENPRVMSLPGTVDTENTVGLRWDMDRDDGHAGGGAAATPVKYHLWRWAGENGWDAPTALDEYDPITADSASELLDGATPVLATTTGDGPVSTPEDWPDARMHAMDRGLADGWYSYRVVGVDVFGRFSEPSDRATWSTYDPIEDADDLYADRAIEVESDRAPPPPTAIEAAALDPASYPDGVEGLDADEIPPNPDVRQDERYRSWRAENPTRTGLRVRWVWPESHAEMAPDAAEFDVYVGPGRRNASVGEVTSVTETTTGYEVTVDVDTGDADAAAYAGTMLTVGTSAFQVTSAVSIGGEIELTVRPPVDRGGASTDGGETGLAADTFVADDEFVAMFPPSATGPLDVSVTVPEPGDRCTLSVPPAYTDGTVTVDADETAEVDGVTGTVVEGHRTDWDESLEGRTFAAVDDDVAYEVARVEGPTELVLDRTVAPSTRGSFLPYRIAHPLWTDGTDPEAWGDAVVTVDVNDPEALIGTDGLDGEDEGSRVYEVIVPAPATDPGEAFSPSLSTPTVYADVAVTASDKAGNRSPVDGSATVARVHHETPDPPEGPPVPVEFERATRPDYDGESAYTVRWEKPDAGDAYGYHVFRALDEALFTTDLERRVEVERGVRERDDRLPLDPDSEELFPPALRGPDGADERAIIADEIAAFSAHAEAVADAVDDEDDDAAADARAAALADYRALREEFDPADAESAVDADAKALRPAVLATLAALPGNAAAFSQRTGTALVPSEHADRVGPDGDESYDPDDDLCAWVDRFDGAARNCYLYRVGTVDDAGNRSDAREDGGAPMSYPTMPVKSPAVVPPQTPRVVDVEAGHPDEDVAGDRAITLRIEGVTDPTLDHLLVYRAGDAEAAADLRSMAEPEVVVPETDGTGVGDAARFVWVDEDVEPFTPRYYRIVAVSDAGVHTTPTSPVSAQAFDRSPPATPTWDDEDPDVDADGHVTLAWTPADEEADLMYQLERRPSGPGGGNGGPPSDDPPGGGNGGPPGDDPPGGGNGGPPGDDPPGGGNGGPPGDGNGGPPGDGGEDGPPDDVGSGWRAVGPWTTATEFTDVTRDGDETYDYRLLVTGAAGGTNDELELEAV